MSSFNIANGTAYDVWLLAQRPTPGVLPAAYAVVGPATQAVPLRLLAPGAVATAASVTTLSGVPPLFANATPALRAVGIGAVTLTVALTEPGTVHYVAVLGSAVSVAGVPNATSIAAGTDAAGSAAAAAGMLRVMQAWQPVVIALTGLPQLGRGSVNFTFFAFADGGSENATLRSATAMLPFATPHVLPPLWLVLNVTGVANSNGTTVWSVVASLDEPGRVTYVVLPAVQAARSPPSAAQVLAGFAAGSAATHAAGFFAVAAANTTVAFTHGSSNSTGSLLDAVDYVLFALAVDAAGNAQSAPQSFAFSTPAGSAPLFAGAGCTSAEARVGGPACALLPRSLRSMYPYVLRATPSGSGANLMLVAQLASDGVLLYKSTGANIPALSRAQLYASGTRMPLLAGQDASLPLSCAALPCAVYVAVASTDGTALGDGSTSRDNRTATVRLAPALLSLSTTNTSGAFSFRAALTAPGYAAYVALRAGAAPPSAAQVLAGTDAAGLAPGAAGSAFPAGGSSALAATVSVTAATGQVALSSAVSGVAARTPLDVYVVTRPDAAGDTDADGQQAGERSRGAPLRVQVSAPPAGTPSFATKAVDALQTPQRVTLAVALTDAPAFACALAQRSGGAAPSAAGVLARGVCTPPLQPAGNSALITLVNLTNATAYDVWLAADAVPNAVAPWEPLTPLEPVKLQLSTPPASPTGTASTEGLGPSMSDSAGGTWPRSTHPVGQRNFAHATSRSWVYLSTHGGTCTPCSTMATTQQSRSRARLLVAGPST